VHSNLLFFKAGRIIDTLLLRPESVFWRQAGANQSIRELLSGQSQSNMSALLAFSALLLYRKDSPIGEADNAIVEIGIILSARQGQNRLFI